MASTLLQKRKNALFNVVAKNGNAKNAQVAASLLQACCLCSHQDDIRIRSYRLLRLDDNKSAASCQQA